jgi:hypothetical protein
MADDSRSFKFLSVSGGVVLQSRAAQQPAVAAMAGSYPAF